MIFWMRGTGMQDNPRHHMLHQRFVWVFGPSSSTYRRCFFLAGHLELTCLLLFLFLFLYFFPFHSLEVVEKLGFQVSGMKQLSTGGS